MNIPVGAFIGLRDKKDLLLAVVLDVADARIRFMSEKGREDRIQADKVLVTLGQSASTHDRDALIARLAQLRQRVDALRSTVDLDTLWQLLKETADERHPEDLAVEFFGATTAGEHRAAMVASLLADSVFFKQKGEAYVPRPESQVKDILLQRRAEQLRTQERALTARWLRELGEPGSVSPPPPCAGRFLDLLKAYSINPEGFDGQGELAALVRELGLGALDRWGAFELLVKAGIWSEDENLMLHQHHVPDRFDAAAMSHHATQVAAGVPVREGAEDLTGLDTFTIDDASTKDIDDALSLEDLPDGFRVGIHIADVSACVKPGDALDVEAARRGQTIYLPERNIPMIPDALTTGVLSLVAGETHPAFSVLAEFDAGLKLRGFRLCFSRIVVRRRRTYDDVDAELASEMGSDAGSPTGSQTGFQAGPQIGSDTGSRPALGSPLARLLALATELRRLRQAAGALIFSVPEMRVTVGPDGSIDVQRLPADSPAHVLVSEMMVLANALVAGWMRDKGVGAIYRGQAGPDEPVTISGYDPVLFYRLRKLLKRPESSLAPRPHSGLGVGAYVQISSPIRRYVDLIHHRQLAAALAGQPPPYGEQELAGIADAADRSADVAGIVQRAGHRYWMLKHLRTRLGLPTPAIVLEKRDESWMVLLADYQIEVPLHARPDARHEVGEHLHVRIVTADPRRGFVRIEDAQ